MRAPSLALLVVLAATGAIAADPIPTPADFGRLFCEGSLTNDMSVIEGTMTPDLALAVAEANARNAQIQAQAPDEKPPLGDGLPWRSYPDYADGCQVGEIAEAADGATSVEILYSFKDWPQADYADRLVLRPSINDPGFWELDDINLIDDQTMRTYLAAAFGFSPSN